MTIFELVKFALDELYAEGVAIYGKNLDVEIKGRMEYLSASYAKLTDPNRPPVNYKDAATRFAYVYKYVASHSDYVVQVLQQLRLHVDKTAGKGSPIFAGNESIRVSCIGGGPGSDIIAVLKYLDEQRHVEKIKKVTCYLLDREQAWADTWTELDDSLELDVSLHANFQPLDVTQPDTWAQQKKFLQADLFTMSYFVSEVSALDKDGVVTKFWQTIFKEAKSGALFLYDDNGSEAFNTYFDSLWKEAKLELLVDGTNEETWPRHVEQKDPLGPYLTKFGQMPKLKTRLTYRVLRKP